MSTLASHNQNMISNIFCSGKILHYVQMSRIFNDSKHFVDMKLKYPVWKVEDEFKLLLNVTNNNPDKEDLKKFVEKNFDPPGSGFQPWIPDDWKKRPKFIDNIQDVHLQNWALQLNSIWTKLGRSISEDVERNSSLYSQIYVPHPFIIPGGRFREFYYWDSYWIIEGLLLSEMFDTALKMLLNYIYLVELYGYIPNGGRVYFLERSQPPFLIPMFNLYYEATKNDMLLMENIATLEKEFQFWMKNRSVTIVKDGITYIAFQYRVETDSPRPESYYEDVLKAQNLSNDSKNLFYSEIKTAAESGWDFSSRWFLSDGERTLNFSDLHPSHLVPVCLTSIIANNAKTLSKFFEILNDQNKSDEYNNIANDINKTISRVFWNDDEGMWFDYNIKQNKVQKGFYPSNLMPLWAKAYGTERDVTYIAECVLSYLNRINITSYPGGIPTSLMNSSQQWDLPNGWAPLQYFAIIGLRNIGEIKKDALLLAHVLAENWVVNCYSTFQNSLPHAMFEKYDVTKVGVPGGGGEYSVQEGFGWTNGVAMKFLSLYGQQIETSKVKDDPVPVILGFVLFTISIVAVVSYACKVKHSQKGRKFSNKFIKLKDVKIEENFV
ncbi:UNVERIFIED_CONTAM: hypothetical protein RMT77_018471 [Armadillidium vulgare]